jgi:transposase
MQKALDQMNLQIHRALNDITGVSGLKILDAILAGQRDSLALARLCHGGVKSSEDTIAKLLEGDYRPGHCPAEIGGGEVPLFAAQSNFLIHIS